MRRWLSYAALAGLGLSALLAGATFLSLRDAPDSLRRWQSDAQSLQVLDRHGQPLTVSYQGRWNLHDVAALHEVPPLLRAAVVAAEDRRFYAHGGVDWRARAAALWQNAQSGRVVRGASTLTEQVVRMLHPRPRNLWSKWIEGIEAARLERRADKAQILEFYLNQAPYAQNRRGVVQAARYYFDRDLGTLNAREMLTLAVLIRAPSGFDLYRDAEKITPAVKRLAAQLDSEGQLPPAARIGLFDHALSLRPARLPVEAGHFAAYARQRSGRASGRIATTLDGALQVQVQQMLDARLAALQGKNLHNGAVLVADHRSGEILAWAVGGANDGVTPARDIDAVLVPRQPGSVQKPFLYARALDKGWTAATLLNDAPLAEAVGTGLHNFRNYSNIHYGRVPLREALANSLNIPALLTIRHVGVKDYLGLLHRMGFDSLTRAADIYDDGLALGNGEVTLLELAQGYGALANRGVWQPLRVLQGEGARAPSQQVYSPEAASLTGDILSDGWARRLEFGRDSVLSLPVQTAVKTGTSTDYRDAWVAGYDSRYLVAVWMGNLDRQPTDGVTGATGPALVLRSVFAHLNRRAEPLPLWLSPRLVSRDVCIDDPQDSAQCYMRSEYFAEGREDEVQGRAPAPSYEMVRPTEGLRIAIDPRVPRAHQKFAFTLKGLAPGQQVEWILNGAPLAQSGEKYLWQVERGKHSLAARVIDAGRTVAELPPVSYTVR